MDGEGRAKREGSSCCASLLSVISPEHANPEKVMQVARNEMNEERAPLRDAADVRMGQEGGMKRLTTCNLIPSHMSIDGSNDWIS